MNNLHPQYPKTRLLAGRRLATSLLAASFCAVCLPLWGSAALHAQTTPNTAGKIEPPASYEGELPGADSAILWHLDLLANGSYQLRRTYKDKPAPNQFDELGRWTQAPETGRIELHPGTGRTHSILAPQENGALLMLDQSGKPIEASKQLYLLAHLAQPAPIEPRMELTGMFTYMADAASITLCADGRRLPVAMEGDYKALEAAYRKAGKPGQPLLVKVDGRIASHPSMEESQPPRATLVVERFISVSPRESCGTPLAKSSLRNTYWKLVTLNGDPVKVAERQREAHLIFAKDEARVSGSTGCNRVMGPFEADGSKLHFGNLISTRMACLGGGMELEQKFLQTLTKVESYRISGSHLEMLDASGTVVARFEAVALR